MLFVKWLSSGRNSDRQRYIAQRRLVAGVVKRAKNEWLQEKARIVEVGMLSSGSKGSAWKSMRDIQKRWVGLRPTMTRVIRKAGGDRCVGRVCKMKGNKASGKNGVLPEMIKCCGTNY